TSGAPSPAPRRTAGDTALYRAVWRWHFYAGLLVLPSVILLSVTGGLYLFKDEINDLLHGDLRIVEARDAAPLPASALVSAALVAHPGEARGMLPAPAPDRSAAVKVRGEDGETRLVYVNPYDGQVLGALRDGGSAGSPEMWTIRKLHSLALLGWGGERMVEAAAGWILMLCVTGIYLWWPRGRGLGVFRLRRGAVGRPFWRDLHAVTGAWAGLVVVFLALSGLPWSGFWSAKFYETADALGMGMPSGYWGNYPQSTPTQGEVLDRTPWLLEQAPMPASSAPAGDHAGHADHAGHGDHGGHGDAPMASAPLPAVEGVPAGLDQVVATLEGRGLHPGYALNFPAGETGVFTGSVYPDDITREQVIHVDRYSGEVLFDMGLADLGALGAAAEWGVSIHMGQAFGRANQLLMLAACLGLLTMAVAAAAMWWKRRP
ncbi:MAG: PepSY domain-containing protein, partial [Pseudomonadota bacterium]|nr:PepSY domain-containing protein [Pseudomonadota bacterium]